MFIAVWLRVLFSNRCKEFLLDKGSFRRGKKILSSSLKALCLIFVARYLSSRILGGALGIVFGYICFFLDVTRLWVNIEQS